MGWQTVAKAVEHDVNNLPLGYLLHQGENSQLLSVLRPNLLKLNAGNGRAPSGMFDVPDRAQDLMHKVDKTYNLWYRIWCDEYIPIIVKRQIWHNEEENLEENDIVYSKLTDSPLSPNWIIGKIDHTIKSKDGKVRTVGISYKHDTENGERKFRIVERPVRQTVKLMNIDETSLIDDIRKVHEDASKRFDDQKLIREETFDNYLDETFGRDCNIVWKNSCSDIHDKFISNTVRNYPVHNSLFLKQENFAYFVQTDVCYVEHDDEQNEIIDDDDINDEFDKQFFSIVDKTDPDAVEFELVLL